jgi:hypothetical protein
MIADVAGGTLNSSAANLSTAVKGVASGTLSTLKGNFGSEVSVILNVTFDAAAIVASCKDYSLPSWQNECAKQTGTFSRTFGGSIKWHNFTRFDASKFQVSVST